VGSALFGEEVLRLPYYHFLETRLDGIPLVVTRTGWTAEVATSSTCATAARASSCGSG